MDNSKTTIKDIAKLAGVSRGTVDRVINNRGQVAKAKRERILKIVEKLGYQKNVIAQNLALNKERSINIVIPFHHDDQYWEMIHAGISSNTSILNQFNIKVFFFQFEVSSKEDYLRRLKEACSSSPDFVLIAPVFTKETLTFLKSEDTGTINFSAINSELDYESMITFLGQDSFKAGEIIGRLFHKSISKKERKILCITLGHDEDNAIHIQKKIEGLKDFNEKEEANFELFIETIETYYDDDKIARHCKQIEKKYPEVDGILFTNSRAKTFIRQSTYFKQKKEDLIAIGFDLIKDNIQLLKSGHLDFLLNERPYEQGRESVNNIINYLIRNQEIPKNKYLPLDIVVKENWELY